MARKGLWHHAAADILRFASTADSIGKTALTDQERSIVRRTFEAYETGLKHNDTRMVLKPDSDFFKYFADPAGRAKEGAKK